MEIKHHQTNKLQRRKFEQNLKICEITYIIKTEIRTIKRDESKSKLIQNRHFVVDE
jgi:uncharacterized protein YkuJ